MSTEVCEPEVWDDWDGYYEDDEVVDLAKILGRGYNAFWHDRHLYRFVKGSKGSKKSKSAALNLVHRLMEYPEANLLVVRRFSNTLADSCFTDLLWAMNKLKVREYWQVSESRLKMRHIETGQKILFRGLDDSSKQASITVEHGVLCWIWFEEFSEVTNEDDFIKLTMSIRGEMPPGLWKQFTCTFNPWSENLWFKAKFFDREREDTFTLTTTYKDNEHLDAVDRQRYLDLYETNPRMARVVCDGEWGIAEGLVYENFVMEDFNIAEIQARRDLRHVFGLDFGFKVSYNAFVAASIDVPGRIIYVWDEMYERGQSNLELARKLTEMGYSKETIWADSAAPLSIHELQEGLVEIIDEGLETERTVRWALPNIRGAIKGQDSINSGIARLQNFRFIVHPRCTSFYFELNNYCYAKDKDGKCTEKPEKDFNHCLVAGTMVLTDHGQVPIEDIQVGDMVMSHLGFMPVEAAGITQLEAEIWRLECEDGTVLEGTWNHPLITNAGIVYLKDAEGLYVVKHGAESSEEIQSNPDAYHLPARDPVLNQKRGSESVEDFVLDAMQNRNGCGLVRIKSIENTGRREIVYDLTVAVSHDFFANNLITANCMDAVRYATTPLLTSGRGRVCEIKGGSAQSTPDPDRPVRCRRVVSTI